MFDIKWSSNIWQFVTVHRFIHSHLSQSAVHSQPETHTFFDNEHPMIYLDLWQLYGTSASPFTPTDTPGSPWKTHTHTHILLTMLVSQIQAWSKDSHLHNQSVRRWGTRREKILTRESLFLQETPESMEWGGGDKCVCEEKTQRELFPPLLHQQINFTLSHLPTTLMSFTLVPVAMETPPLTTVHSYTSVFPLFLPPPSLLQSLMRPAHLYEGCS